LTGCFRGAGGKERRKRKKEKVRRSLKENTNKEDSPRPRIEQMMSGP